MLEMHGIACDLVHGFTWDKWTSGTAQERGGGAAGETAAGRDQGPVRPQCRPGPALLREAQETLNAYHNRAIAAVEVIEELIKLAKEIEAANKRGDDLGLTDDGRRQPEGDRHRTGDQGPPERDHRLELARRRPGQDPGLGETDFEPLRLPPDLQEEAVRTVLRQAELLCAEWV